MFLSYTSEDHTTRNISITKNLTVPFPLCAIARMFLALPLLTFD
jgi:hypothetical protein